jgi:hypothetical protein
MKNVTTDGAKTRMARMGKKFTTDGTDDFQRMMLSSVPSVILPPLILRLLPTP